MIAPPTPFQEYLAKLAGSTVYFEELAGNNGDALIRMGMQELFDQLGIKPVAAPEDADCIILCGGGAMNDLWPEGAAQVLDRYMKKFPEKRYLVGPSSYYFTQLDFASIVNQVDSPVALFCREEISRELLGQLDLKENVEIALSPDLALELEGSDFIKKQSEKVKEDIILCGMRKDREGNAGVLAKTSASWLPAVVRKPLSKLRDRLVASKSGGLLETIMSEISPPVRKEELVYRDVSVSVGFDEFCEQIRSSRAIITNRLHIAIFGSLLGKEVHLVPGAYHKIEGVYQYSLSDCENVSLH